MLTFLAVVVTLFFLPAVLMVVLFPGPATRLWRRMRPAPVAAPMTAGTVGLPVALAGGRSALDRAGSGGAPRSGETCDRCDTAAVAAAYLPAGDLLWCGHHGRQYECELKRRGAVIVGELAFAAERPVRSSG